MSDLKDIPSERATNFPQRTRETLQTLIGTRGDKLDRAVRLRDLVASGLIALRPGIAAGVGIGTVPLVVGPNLTDSEIYVKDLTPPPTPTGFDVDAAISHIFVAHDAPTYTQGHGHLRTRLYGVSILPGDPLPTFSDAAEITQFSGTVHAHPSNPATTWRLWIKWETRDNELSAIPAGGTNGLEATTGTDVSKLLDALSGKITEGQLFEDLGSRISLIDGSGPGSVDSRIAAEATARATAILAATNAFEAADSALQNQIDMLASVAGGDLSALLDAVNQERADRIAAVLAESDARGLADTAISGALTNETAARQISDSDLGAVANLLMASIGASTAAVANMQTASATGDAALATQQQTLRAAVEGATAAIQTEQSARAAADEANAARTTAVVAQVSQSASAITTEQLARATADASSATRIDVISAATGAASAAIRTEQDARTENDSALASRSDAIAVQLGQAAAGITLEQQARIDADGVQAAQTAGLLAAIPGVQAALQVEQQARAAEDSSLALQTTLLGASFGDLSAALVVEQQARADADSAASSQITTLQASVRNAPVLPSTFLAGIEDWTSSRGGSPATVATYDATIITNDPDLGTCARITNMATAGTNILTKGVMPCAPGRIYQVTSRFKVEALPADGSFTMNSVIPSLSETFGNSSTAFGTSTDAITALGIYTTSAKISDVALPGILAWAASAKYVRFGLRLNSTEAGGNPIIRVQSILVEDVTDAVTLNASLQTLQAVVIENDSATSTQIDSLSAASGANAAALAVEQAARSNADAALASQSSTLAASAGQSLSAIAAEQSARSASDSAQATQISSLISSTAVNTAAISTEAVARANGDSALATRAETIEARQVTRPNMLPNGGFESGLTGWTPAGTSQSLWASSDGAWGRAAIMTAPVGAPVNGVGTLSSDWMDVEGGTPYTIHGDAALFGGAGSSVHFDLIFRDASNNIVLDGGQNSKGPSFNFAADDTNRSFFAVTATAPANAVRTQARFVFTAVNATTIGCRMIKVERGALPYTPYTSEQASVALGAAIQEERSARITAIEAEALAREALEAAVDSNTAAISTEASARATADAANATQITTVQSRLNRVVNYRIQAKGSTATIGVVGLYNEAGTSLYGGVRSYTVVVLNGSTGAIISRTTYDVFGIGAGTGGGTATTMAADLNALTSDKVVIVFTSDEPQNNRLTGGLPEAMYRCGASRAVFGSSAFKYRSAYILVGIPGIGEGMGVERYVGAVDSDPNAWVDYQLQLINGRPVALGGSPTAAAIQIESTTRAAQTGELYAKYTVKTDVAGLVSGYGLASTANNAAPTSSFGVRASSFYIAPPSVASATAPTENLYKGFVWLDTSVTPNVTKFYTGSAWTTTPQALPFSVQTAPTTVGGIAVPAGVYMDAAFIRNATITSAKILSVKADSIQTGFLSAVTSHTGALYNGVDAYTLTVDEDTGVVTAVATEHAPGTVNFGTGYYLSDNKFFVGSPTKHMLWDGSALTVRGTIYATAGEIGGITIASNAVRAGQTAYNTGTGFHLGSDGRLSLGNSSGNRLTWDGTNISVVGSVNGGAYTGYAWPASGGTGFHLGPNGLLLGNANDGKYLQVTSSGDIYTPRLTVINGNLSIGGGKFVAGTDGKVYADEIEIRRRPVIQNGTLDPTDVLYGTYSFQTSDSKGNIGTGTGTYPAGTVFRGTIQQIIYTDIYDFNTQNASINQPYYAAAYFNGSAFRNWSGTNGSTFDLHLGCSVASIRGYSNAGVFTNNGRVAIVFTYAVRLVSGSFNSFRLPTATWSLFKI